MEKIIQEILDELFIIDPGLKKYQKELEATMAKMIANKPQDKFDENFRQELKMKLLARVEELEKGKSLRPSLWKNLAFWRGMSLAAATIVLAVILVVPAVRNGWISMPEFGAGNPLENFSKGAKIEGAGERAFGDLSSRSQAVFGETDNSSGVTAPTAAPQTTSSTSREAVGFGGGGGSGVSSPVAPDIKMMPPEYMTKYNYVYAGEDFSFTDTSVAVLRREKGFSNGDLNSVLGNIGFGLFDASKLNNAKVQNLSLAEDRDGGYIVDFNSYEGIISMYENWQRMIPVDYNSLPRLAETDVPSDEKLIAATNDFMNRYGIDLTNFGAPKVSKNWRIGILGGAADAEIWVPDTMTVQYPLVVDGREVWEQGGYERSGLSVNVNIRTMKVTSFYGLQTQNYQSSNYAAETDKDRLLKFALQGDLWPQGDYPVENFKVKEVEVKLGTPRVEFMRYWKYDVNQSIELLVPALVFPVLETTPADEAFYKSAVVIPLAKEILDSAEANNTITPPTILKSETVTEPAPAVRETQ
jgi:hypothetical protein